MATGRCSDYYVQEDEVERAIRRDIVTQKSEEEGHYRCLICNQTLKSRTNMARHLTCKTHLAKAQRQSHFNDSSAPEVQRRSNTNESPTFTSESRNRGHYSEEDEVERAIRKGIVTQKSEEEGHYRCLICNQTLKSRTNMARHLTCKTHLAKAQRQAHNNESPTSTSEVQKQVRFNDSPTYTLESRNRGHYSEEDDVERAIRKGIVTQKSEEEGHYRCLICNQTLKSRTNMARHLTCKTHLAKAQRQAHNNESPTSTSERRYSDYYSEEEEVERAIRDRIVVQTSSEEDHYRCVICDQKLKSRTNVARHLTWKSHLNMVQMQSPVNSCVTSTSESSSEYYDSEEEEDEDEVERAIRKGIVTQASLEDDNHYRCLICNQTLKSRTNMARHLTCKTHLAKAQRQSHYDDSSASTSESSYSDYDDTEEEEDEEEVERAIRKGIVTQASLEDDDHYRCLICSQTLESMTSMARHLTCKTHLTKELQQPSQHEESYTTTLESYAEDEYLQGLFALDMSNGTIIDTRDAYEPFWCNICKESFKKKNFVLRHIQTPKHQFKKKVVIDSDDIYVMKSTPLGHVYVFNYKFEHPHSRPGAEHDSTNLKSVFTEIGYKVFIFEDFTKEQTLQQLEAIRGEKDLSNVDSLILIFLSHGEDPYKFYSNDLKPIDMRDVKSNFVKSKCPQMSNKPKIILANYCRGVNNEYEYDDVEEPFHDMVNIYASPEGNRALRSADYGTVFICSLCAVLEEEKGKNIELREIYRRLHIKMKNKRGTSPTWDDCFFKRFYIYGHC